MMALGVAGRQEGLIVDDDIAIFSRRQYPRTHDMHVVYAKWSAGIDIASENAGHRLVLMDIISRDGRYERSPIRSMDQFKTCQLSVDCKG